MKNLLVNNTPICKFSGDVFVLLGTDPVKGLSQAKAAEHLQYYGHNTLTPATQHGWIRVLFNSMCTGKLSTNPCLPIGFLKKDLDLKVICIFTSYIR